MEQSILLSTKKVLGVGPDDESFDLDILTFINSAFSTLHDLGVGPAGGFTVEDAETEWADLAVADPTYPLDDVQINSLKTYTFLKVRLLFDPPTTSYLLGAFEKQVEEHAWRINTRREATEWVDPDPPIVEEEV